MIRRRRLSRKGLILVCVICLITGIIGGIFIGKSFSKTILKDYSIYDEIVDIIELDYLDTVDADISIEERMLNGLVLGLGDPYTAYMNPKEANELTDSINGSFVGIGVSYTKIDKGGLVLQVFKDSPADKAGIKAGDVITHVEGNEIKSFDMDKIKESILGKPGTEVNIRVLRLGEYHDVTITRNQVESSVEGEIRTVDGVLHGYVLLTTFGDATASLLEKQLKTFKDAGVENIIIDLRGNSGGYLSSVQGILDLFIKEGEILLTIEDNNQVQRHITASNTTKYSFKEGIVLIDNESASSSEVMTAALQDHLGYTLIGEKTFGKGVVQTQMILSDSSTLKYTHAKWLTPKGKCIQGTGIEPDIEVKGYDVSDIPLFSLDKDYKNDDVSDYIAATQTLLKKLGYNIDREDGYFSKQTETCLKQFESTYNLDVNGILETEDLTVIISNLVHEITYNQDDIVYNRAIECLK